MAPPGREVGPFFAISTDITEMSFQQIPRTQNGSLISRDKRKSPLFPPEASKVWLSNVNSESLNRKPGFIAVCLLTSGASFVFIPPQQKDVT